MTRTKLILAGLIAGALTFGTACKSDKVAEREPADATMQPETMNPDTGGAPMTPEAANPDGTGGAGADDMGGRGGSGDTGYDEDTSEFDDSQELGGNKFPSDDTAPRP